MSSTHTSPEWRDDMPRTFSVTELPPHVASVHVRRRRLSAALLIPRLVSSNDAPLTATRRR